MLDIPQTISGGQESKGGEIHFPCRDSAMEKKEEEISTFAFSRNVKNPIKITTTITRETETEKTPVESTSSLRKKDVNTDFPQTSQNSTSGVSMKASGGGMDKNSNPSRERIVHLRTLASTITPLHRYFSFVTQDKRIGGKDLYSPNCVRCPNCKGCQLHMQFCSGAYGMRHMLAWIVRRKSPKVGEKRTIEMRYISENTSNLNYSWRSVCRFEIGPVVITRHLIHSSKEQIIETVERGGTNGTFAGMISPRPLNFLDVFFGIFYGTTDRGRDKRYYRVLQRTAMRSVAAQARALWEKLTFSPEKQNLAVLAQIPRNKKENGDFIPQRVQVDWRCPPLFFSLLPSAQEGNSGLTFVLWISVLARSCLTAHVMDNGELWRSPHTCTVETEKEKKETTTTTTTTTVKSTTTPLWDENFISTSNGKWEGEVRCRRCHIPGSHWGLITRRHREEKDKVVTILRVRRSCIQREVTRRAILSHYHNNSIHKKPNMNNGEKEIKNDVIWVNKQKTRAQFMALLVAYMMRTTVCGPYKQRHLTSSPSETEAIASVVLPTPAMDSSSRRSQTSLRSNRGNGGRRPTITHLEQNKKDGISLKRADIEAAFAFFDVQNKKELKPRDLKMRLSAFYPGMTNKEFKFLLDETTNGSFTVDSLWNIIENFHGLHTSAAESLRFDPVKEAFHIYDPNGQGVVDVEALAGIMKRIGLGELSREEMDLLIQTADFDKDGKINLEDFRNLLRIGR